MKAAPVAGRVASVAYVAVLIRNRREESERAFEIAAELDKGLEVSEIFVHPPDGLEDYAVAPVRSGEAFRERELQFGRYGIGYLTYPVHRIVTVPCVFEEDIFCIKFGENHLRREHCIAYPRGVTLRIIYENILTAGQHRVDAGKMNPVDNVVVALEMRGLLEVGMLDDGGQLDLVVISDYLDLSKAVESHVLVEYFARRAV